MNSFIRCARCSRALEDTAAWKARHGRFYCNEFCAEAEEVRGDIAARQIAAPSITPDMPVYPPDIETPARR